MKKLLSILFTLAFIQLFATVALGAVNYDIDVTNGELTVSGTGDVGDHMLVAVMKTNNAANDATNVDLFDTAAFPSGKTAQIGTLLSSDPSITSLNLNTYKVHLVDVEVGANGKYSVKLPIVRGTHPTVPNGIDNSLIAPADDTVYLVMVNGSYENTYDATAVYYPGSTTVSAALSAINAATTPEQLKTAIDTYDNALGLNTAHATYKELGVKVAKAILSQKGSFTYTSLTDLSDPASFKKHFNIALEYYTLQRDALALINRLDASANDLKTVLETYSNISGTLISNENVLGEYAGAKIDCATKYSTYDYITINSLLIGRAYTSMDAFKSAFDAAVPSVNPTSPGGGAAAPIVPTIEIPSEDKVNEVVNVFNDIADVEWARPSIIKLSAMGVINGMGDGSFNPNGQVTREQLVKMLVEMFAADTAVSNKVYADVDSTAWYAPYVATATALGIVNGISETEFGVGMPVTRQDLATMICRACDIFYIGLDATTSAAFTDDDQIAGYAVEAVERLANAGIINGVAEGVFAPKQNTTRAQVAVMLDRLTY